MADYALIIGGSDQKPDLAQVKESLSTLAAVPGVQTTVVDSQNIDQVLENLQLSIKDKDTFTLHVPGQFSKNQEGEDCIPLKDQCYSAKILSQKINRMSFKEGAIVIDPLSAPIGVLHYFASSRNVSIFPTLQSALRAKTAKDLNDSDPMMRLKAILALSTQDHPEASVPEFIKALDDKDDKVRFAAIEALGSVNGAVAPAVLKLSSFLIKNDPFTKKAAIQAIANAGKAAKITLFDLGLALGDTNDKVREAAQKALVKLAVVLPNEVVTRLLAVVVDYGEDNRENAAKALGQIASKKDTAAIANRLLGLLKSKDTDKIVWAIEALPNFVESLSVPKRELVRSRFITVLKPFLNDSKPEVIKKSAEKAMNELRDA